MSPTTFVKYLSTLTLFTALLLFFLNQWTVITPYSIFSWLSLSSFVLLSLLMYIAGYITAASDNKNAFTTIILGFTLGKMMLSLCLVVLYHHYATPTSKAFIIPFFVVYLIFTIFETWFMMLLGKQKRTC